MAEKPTWRKSSYSSGTGNSECVELWLEPDLMKIRDSKAPQDGELVLRGASAVAFLQHLKETMRKPDA